MYFINIFLLMFTLICVDSLSRPRLRLEDGELIITPSKGRNISLETTGKGKVLLNGVDLSNAVKLVLNASHILDKYTANFGDSFNKIDEFDELLRGKPNGILFRVARLDTKVTSLTNVTAGPVSNTKLIRMSKQLQSAMSALDSLTKLLKQDECKSNPCSNGGECQDLFNNFICHCPDQWEGPRCDIDVNECSRFVGTDLGCQNGATCINKPGSYQCICTKGWYGVHCTRRSKDCDTASSSTMCGHGICVPQNTDLGYKCICDQGYTNSPSSQECVDVDECKSGRAVCSVNPLVSCINTPGSFRCGNCPEGFSGNGFYCTDIDECQSTQNGCSKNPSVECINTMGSYKCGSCPPGYDGDGRVCSYKGICNVNNGGCHPLATCKENKNNPISLVECTCPPGYLGNAMGPRGCLAPQTPWSSCSPNPCNNGTCIPNTNGTYTCRCNSPYFGKNCQMSLHPCSNHPCQNGGTCSPRGFFFRCSCTGSWTGPTCSVERSACGGVISQEIGLLQYPPTNFSLNPEVRSCAWIIETSKNKILKIEFKEFHMKYTRECNKDWLQMHDGRNTAFHSLGRYCGNNLPKNGSFSTTHNAIYLWFRTDGTSSDTGFSLSWKSTIPLCDNSISVTSHGSIQSPGSPGMYPNNRDCFWKLNAPDGKRLQFHFFSFDVGSSTNCSGDYLEIYSTSNNRVPPFAKYCNSSVLPSSITSPGPTAVVHFHSDDKVQHPGFQMSYSVVEGIPGCGGIFTASRGEIQPPSYKGRYLEKLDCVYHIKLEPELRVKLEFISFELETERSCKYDYLEIFEGPDTNSPLVGKYCGSNLPGPYLSNGNEITIHFKSDWASGFKGVVLRYETVCGKKFTEKTGVIQSDGYPMGYASGVSCLYEIIQPPGTIITLKFLDFHLEHNSGTDEPCYDYVEVRDGDSENSTLVGRFCNESIPREIISTFNYLWITFVTDESVTSTGFRANYSVTDIGCGGLLKETAGIISPQFESGIRPSCNWIIRAPIGYVIRVMWVTFQLVERYVCDREYIKVFDNNTMTGRGGLIGKYCGHRIPPSFISTSNVVTLSLFLEKSATTSSGFTLSYNFIKESKICGGDFHSAGGVIRSPNYPNEVSHNTDCVWTITVEQNHQILLNVTNFQMENSDQCKYDAIEIRNGKYASSPLIGRFCGTKITKLISSHANQIYIHFKTDNNGFGGRFEMIWGSAATGCRGVLTALSGSIISPMYPESYNKFTDCSWKISVSAGSLVQIIFTDIDLEPHSACLLDYVQVFDGSSSASKSLGTFCSLTHPTFIRTTQNHAFVRFKSDVSFEGRGFQLQYTTVCQNNLTGFYGVIESPNFPFPYKLSEDCIWNIIVEAKNKINITFTTFDVRTWNDYGNKTCNSNSLEIKYEVSSMESPSYNTLGKYCGPMETPKMLSLDHDRIQIVYQTKSNVIGSGFRLEWALDGCGGKLYYSGSFQSPNYPRGYPESSACRWELETEFGNSIVLTFDEIDVERTNKCTYDSLKVFNGPDSTYPLIAQFCHQDRPIKVTSNGNKMSVHLSTDSSYQGRGISANFTSVKSKCGGTLVLSEGMIFSPNYPKNYDRNDTCEWLLEVDENHLIDLEFDEVALANTIVLCDRTYVKVFDGPSSAYPVLAKLCGNQKPNKTLTSTHNQLFVKFVAHPFVSAKGFAAHFHKACGARVVATSRGEIQMHPEFVDTSRITNCSWIIVAPEPNQQIALTITHMNVRYVDCAPGAYTVRVYDGETENGTMLGSFCGRESPGMILSRGNALHVVAEVYVYLNANYEVFDSTCGGSINSLGGMITSPGFITGATKPLSGTQCEWNLIIAPGNSISFTFKKFMLPASDKCKTDFLEIRRNNPSGKLIGTYCGDQKPADISIEGSLWLMLTTSDNPGVQSNFGFEGSFAYGKNNVLNAPSGQIANPLYPKYFSHYDDYTWRISVTFGKKIIIKFKEISLGSHYETDCAGTGMKIYDGIDSTATLLKEICDYNTPDPVKTSSNEAFISVYFTSGLSKFLIEWEETESYDSPQAVNTTVEGCGSKDVIDLAVMKNYTLKSPGYPDGYADQLNCNWIFSTSQANHLDITFDWVDLRSIYGIYSSCSFTDSVEIFSGKETTGEWKSIKKICTVNETFAVYSTSNLMKVSFTTDYMANGTGFKAEIKEVCGGDIHQSEGTIVLDNNNPIGRKCQWNVTVPIGKTISIDFLKFDIAPGIAEGCRNYLLLRNGLEPDSPFLGDGKYCGTKAPSLKTTSNRLSVKYSGYPGVKGFVLRFKAMSFECGGEINLDSYENSTIISSPNYPNVPSPHIDCVWILKSPPGTSIQLDFHGRFDLTRSEGCTSEAVEVRNGATEYSQLIGRFCKLMPSSQFSTDNMMFVKFITDVDDPKNGFKATASIATCGGTYRGTKGKISWSSDDSRLHQSRNNCTWHVEAPQGYNLILKMDLVEIPTAGYICSGTAKGVQIYSVDPVEGKETFVKKICSRFDTGDITLNSNKAVIYYKHSPTSYSLSKFVMSYNSAKQNCTFRINAPTGRIQTPGYPAHSYHVIHCKWAIEVPEGRKITLTFTDLDLDENLDFQNQGIAMLESGSPKVQKIYARFNNGSTTHTGRQFKTSSNSIIIFYWSFNAHGRGFSAVYNSDDETDCRGSFNETSGSIPVPNATAFFCTWKRRQNSLNTTLKVSATMHMTAKPSVGAYCRTGGAGMMIYNPYFPINLLFSLCTNTTTPAVLKTSYQSLSLQAWGSKDSVNYTFDYNTYPCGGLRKEIIGEISSPNFPKKPSSSVECSWILKLPAGNQINVTFNSLELGDDCNKSFIEIFNGISPKAPRIVKLCKSNTPSLPKLYSVISERNNLLIDYHFEADSNGRGFNLTYQPLIDGCGGIFHDRTRIIQSPGYPRNYPNNSECVWEIRASEGYHIGLSFIGRFHIEESNDCSQDFLKVWEWQRDDWKLLSTLCGRETPKNINSTGNRMKIMFRSNEKIRSQGFRAKWEFNCGGTFVASSTKRYIVSPGYPEKYYNNMQCVYNIQPPDPKHFVNLKFYDFELEYGMPSCTSDNVTIMSLSSYHDRSQRTLYCENSMPPPNSYRFGVKVRFTTDAWVVRRGFKFSYSTTGCGFNVTSPTQISIPSSFDSTYMGSVECEWKIIAPPKKIIALRFVEFVTPYTASCSYDNVIVYDGLDKKAESKLTTLCGNLSTNLPTLNSPNNTMTILSIVDPNSKKMKMVADVFFNTGPSEGCGGTFNLTSPKTLRSPNLHEVGDCFWRFLAPVDNTIELEISDLDLPNCNKGKCTCNFLEIRDGGTTLSTLIARLCNSTTSSIKYRTSTRYGFLRLHMDGTQSFSYRITAKSILSSCGKSLLNVTDKPQIITSPNYPVQYPENTRCRWLLQTGSNYKKMVLRFKQFDLSDEDTEYGSDATCQNDYLEVETGDQHKAYGETLGPNTVFSGRGKSSTSYEYSLMGVHTFCGRNAHIFDYHSPTGSLALIFQSKSGTNRGTGFQIEYQLAGCNRNYTEDFGKILFSLNEKQDCIITISVQANKTISLYFAEFYSFSSTNCSGEYLQIIDGVGQGGKEIRKLCGYERANSVFSKTNHLQLKMHSEKNSLDLHADVTYTSTDKGRGCGGTIIDISGTFTSPMYPNDFRNDTKCVWYIMGPPGSIMELRIDVFDIQAACTENYLKVTTYDSGVENEHKFCKGDVPATLTSDAKFVVLYQAAIHNGGAGWTASFTTHHNDVKSRNIDVLVLD